jgi:predicted nucleotidyltransferase
MSPSPSLETSASHRPAIDAQTARAAGAFMRRIRERFPVSEAYLFGSRARQTHAADSDADVAVVLKGKRANRFAVVQDMAGVAFDVMLETGVNVQALPLWEEDLKTPGAYSNPALLENILRGLRL